MRKVEPEIPDLFFRCLARLNDVDGADVRRRLKLL